MRNERSFAAAALAMSSILAACDASGGGLGFTDGGVPSSVGELNCPNPGRLPFNTQTTTSNNPDNEEIFHLNYDSSFGRDFLGHEGDPQYVEGGYCRSSTVVPSNCRNGLAREHVSLVQYRDGAWHLLGRTLTDEGGLYRFDIEGGSTLDVGAHTVYSIFEATGTCMEHGLFIYPEGTQVVVTDIDGTLTQSDSEFLTTLANPSYVPVQNVNADLLMQTWAEKGYVVIYLTARPNDFRYQSRNWLRQQGFPYGPMETATSFVFGETARTYKRNFIQAVLSELEWDIVAAYGNAGSDVDAYEDGAIPKNVTFTINEAAGANGTVGIPDRDWTAHVSGYVQARPRAQQPF